MKYVKSLDHDVVVVDQAEERDGSMAFILEGRVFMRLSHSGTLLLYSLNKNIASAAGLQLDSEDYIQVIRS